MPRTRISIAALLVLAAVVVSCTDRPAPTEAATAMGRRVGASATGCMALGDLNNLVITVFGTANMPNQNSALHKLDRVTKALAQGNTADAIAKANDLISFIRLKATELAVQAQAQTLINAIECYAGISQNTFLVYPADQPQTIKSEDGQAGIVLPANPVTEPTLITITMLDPNSTSPLITKLDKYPGYVEITQQSGVANSLTGAVTVAVCPVAGIPDSIASRLRLGHQRAAGAAGFDVTPPANASFLTCNGYASTASKLPGWVRSLASLVVPKSLYARDLFSGGVGGTAEEFSPFGPVDPVLSFSGGVGGTAEEFIKAQPISPATGKKQPSATEEAVKGKSSARSTTAEMAVNIITCYQAEVGASAKATGCRPQVTLKTVNQTPFVGVPVTFTVGATGGSVAADAASACGALGSSVTVPTDVNGVARACWTLGDVAADYTVTATPANGGDAIVGVSFSQASYTWTTTALKKSATLTLGNVSQVYDGSGKSVTVATAPADLAIVSVLYDGAAALPTEAGSYAVVATLDHPSYQGTTSGTLTITKATQAALSVTAPGSSVYGTTSLVSATGGTGDGTVAFAASGACSVSGNTLTITNGSGTCTITATRSGGNNYEDVSAALDVATSVAPQAPLTITGAGDIAFGGSDVTLGTTGGDGTGAVTFDAGSSTACSVTSGGVVHVTSGTGTCEVTAVRAADANYAATTSASATMTITKAQAVLTLGTLTQGFDGTAKAVSVTTAPVANLATVSVTYDGLPTAPSAAGDYAVVATLVNADYEATAVSGTLSITKATQSISFDGLSAKTYLDADFTVGATASSGLAVSFIGSGYCTVSGTTVSITGAGSCTVTATQGGDGNYLAAGDVSQSFTIAKKSATVTLGGLAATYSGSGIAATVTTGATGTSTFALTYDGSASLPANAGSYAVVATLNNDNFFGSTTGTLVIGKAVATLTLGNLAATYNGSPKSATVATLPVTNLGSIAITYAGSPAAPVNAGSYTVVATLDNPNYSGSTTGTLVISPVASVITWATPAPIILGTPLSGTQLNATASTTGGFAYTPPAGTVLPAGTSTLSTLFTPATANYSAAPASVSLKVFYKQVGCFASPVYSSMPDTKSYQRKGSNLPIKCTLTTASGASVPNATGSLKIEDLGTNPAALATDANPLVISNAFAASSNGNYSYGLNTGAAKFITLHYYRATATWSDGNTTVGFFYVK